MQQVPWHHWRNAANLHSDSPGSMLVKQGWKSVIRSPACNGHKGLQPCAPRLTHQFIPSSTTLPAVGSYNDHGRAAVQQKSALSYRVLRVGALWC